MQPSLRRIVLDKKLWALSKEYVAKYPNEAALLASAQVSTFLTEDLIEDAIVDSEMESAQNRKSLAGAIVWMQQELMALTDRFDLYEEVEAEKLKKI